MLRNDHHQHFQGKQNDKNYFTLSEHRLHNNTYYQLLCTLLLFMCKYDLTVEQQLYRGDP